MYFKAIMEVYGKKHLHVSVRNKKVNDLQDSYVKLEL